MFSVVRTLNGEVEKVIGFEDYRKAYGFFERLRLGTFAVQKNIPIEDADKRINNKSSIKTESNTNAHIKGKKMPFAEFKNGKDFITITIVPEDMINGSSNSFDKISKLIKGDHAEIFGKTRTIVKRFNDWSESGTSNRFLTSTDLMSNSKYLMTKDGLILIDSDFRN